MTEILLGTSGWSYKEWVGPFYEDAKGMFSYYARFFNTVEINSTFYRFPSKSTIYGLNRVSKQGFIFSAKLPRLITHEKKLNPEENVKKELMRFLELLEPLSSSGKLGCILVQLPPSFTYNRDLWKLEAFLEMIPDYYEFAIEFRNSSWMRDETWKILREHNVAYCVVDEPSLPPEVHVTANFAYFRWHGRSRRPWYNYRYSEKELKEWVPKINETKKRAEKIYGYFNNHFHGYAVENCIEFMQMLRIAKPEHEKIKRRIIDYNLFGDLDVSERNLRRLLLELTDLGRIRRGSDIKDEDLTIQEFSDQNIKAKVKNYIVEFYPKEKILKHNCDDWRKGLEEKRLCKHVVKVLLSINPEKAQDLIENIIKNKHDWKFQTYKP